MKEILGVYSAPPFHWVGDGFPVRIALLVPNAGARRFSPFLLLDYAGPAKFAPTRASRAASASIRTAASRP